MRDANYHISRRRKVLLSLLLAAAQRPRSASYAPLASIEAVSKKREDRANQELFKRDGELCRKFEKASFKKRIAKIFCRM